MIIREKLMQSLITNNFVHYYISSGAPDEVKVESATNRKINDITENSPSCTNQCHSMCFNILAQIFIKAQKDQLLKNRKKFA